MSELFIYKFEGGLLKEVVPLVYCKDCIHRPVLRHNDFEEWVEAPMKKCITSTEWGLDYTCPYLYPGGEYNRRPLGHLFCSFEERA